MKTQNLKFGEAVKNLASLAGMQPYTFSKKDEEREKNWKSIKVFIQNMLKNIMMSFLKVQMPKWQKIILKIEI